MKKAFDKLEETFSNLERSINDKKFLETRYPTKKYDVSLVKHTIKTQQQKVNQLLTALSKRNQRIMQLATDNEQLLTHIKGKMDQLTNLDVHSVKQKYIENNNEKKSIEDGCAASFETIVKVLDDLNQLVRIHNHNHRRNELDYDDKENIANKRNSILKSDEYNKTIQFNTWCKDITNINNYADKVTTSPNRELSPQSSLNSSSETSENRIIIRYPLSDNLKNNANLEKNNSLVRVNDHRDDGGFQLYFSPKQHENNDLCPYFYKFDDEIQKLKTKVEYLQNTFESSINKIGENEEQLTNELYREIDVDDEKENFERHNKKCRRGKNRHLYKKEKSLTTSEDECSSIDSFFTDVSSVEIRENEKFNNAFRKSDNYNRNNGFRVKENNIVKNISVAKEKRDKDDMNDEQKNRRKETDEKDKVQEFIDSAEKDCNKINFLIKGGIEKKKSGKENDNKQLPSKCKEDVDSKKKDNDENEDGDGKVTPKRKKEKRLRLTKKSGKKIKLKGRLFVTSRTSSDFSCIQGLDSKDENTTSSKVEENKTESSHSRKKVSHFEGVDSSNEEACLNEANADVIELPDLQDEAKISNDKAKIESSDINENVPHLESGTDQEKFCQGEANVEDKMSLSSKDENNTLDFKENEKELSDAGEDIKNLKSSGSSDSNEDDNDQNESNIEDKKSLDRLNKNKISKTEANEEEPNDTGEEKCHPDKDSNGNTGNDEGFSQNEAKIEEKKSVDSQTENMTSNSEENEKDSSDVKENVVRLEGGTSSDNNEEVCQNEANGNDKKSFYLQDENTISKYDENEEVLSDVKNNVFYLECSISSSDDDEDVDKNEEDVEDEKSNREQVEKTTLKEDDEEKELSDTRDNICYLENSFSSEDNEEFCQNKENDVETKSFDLKNQQEISLSNEKDFASSEIAYVDVPQTENFEEMNSSDIENQTNNINDNISTENSSIIDKCSDDEFNLINLDSNHEKPLDKTDIMKISMEEDIILPIDEEEVLCSNEEVDKVDCTTSDRKTIDENHSTGDRNKKQPKEKTSESDQGDRSSDEIQEANTLSQIEDITLSEGTKCENKDNSIINSIVNDSTSGDNSNGGIVEKKSDELVAVENEDRIVPEEQEEGTVDGDLHNDRNGNAASSVIDETCHGGNIISSDGNNEENTDSEESKQQSSDIPVDTLDDIQIREWYDSEKSSEEEQDEVDGTQGSDKIQNITLSTEDSKEDRDSETNIDFDSTSEKFQEESDHVELKENQSSSIYEDKNDEVKSSEDHNSTTYESKPDFEDKKLLDKQFPSRKEDESSQKTKLHDETLDRSCEEKENEDKTIGYNSVNENNVESTFSQEGKLADETLERYSEEEDKGTTSDSENNTDESINRRPNVYKRSFSEICIYHENDTVNTKGLENNNKHDDENQICTDLESNTNIQNNDKKNSSKQNKKSITSTPSEEKIYLKNVKKLKIDPSVTNQKTIYLQDLIVEKCQVRETIDNRNDNEISLSSSNKVQMDYLSDVNVLDSEDEKNLIDAKLDIKDENESCISSGNNFDSTKITKELKDSDVDDSLSSNENDNSHTTDIHTYELLKSSCSQNSLGHDYVKIEPEKKRSKEEQLQNEVKIERKPFRRAERGKYEQSMLHKKSQPNERCSSCDKLSSSNSFQEHNISLSESSITSSTSVSYDDVIIVHDSMFKFISNSTVKDKELKIKKLWSPTLQDAYEAISQEQLYPKVVLLHTGATDVCRYSVEDMVERVVRIYEYVSERGIKFIFSEIPPRVGQPEFNEKARLFNSLVAEQIASARDVTICNNHNGEQSSSGLANNVHTINLIENR